MKENNDTQQWLKKKIHIIQKRKISLTLKTKKNYGKIRDSEHKLTKKVWKDLEKSNCQMVGEILK